MSADNIPAFFEKAKTSPELQQKIAEIHHTAAQSAAEALAALSKESDSSFTAAEFLAAGQGELSEGEMSNVAGGGNFPTIGEILRNWPNKVRN